MDAQIQIRQEAEEKQEVLQDLLRWAPETQKRPGARSATSIRPAGPAVPGTQEGVAPLRTRRTGTTEKKGTSSFAPNTLRESTTIPAQASNASAAGHTYDKFSSKWDKFDYDSAMAEADDENGSQKHPFSFPKSSKLAGVPSKTPEAPAKPGMEPRQQNLPTEPTDAELWKDRGNKAFSAKNYAQAKQDYTQSIALQPSCLAYANRAMAELKLEQYSAAEADCTRAIALDAAYVKAYLRRASAAKQLGKRLEATEDYEHALRLEPTSKSTLADRRACLDQLLQQEGLQSEALRAAIPISPPSAQAPAAVPSTTATLAPPPSAAQPLSSTHMLPSTSQGSSKSQQGKPMHSQQDMPTLKGSSMATNGEVPEQQILPKSQQKPGISSMSSAAKPLEPSQQSKPSTLGKGPSSASWQQPSSNREGQPSTSHVPLPGMHTRSPYGMASQRRRAEPSVVIEEVLSAEEDVPKAKSQDPTTLNSSLATSAAAAAPPKSSSSRVESATPASRKRSAIDKPAGMSTAAPASQAPSVPTMLGQSSTGGDSRLDSSSGSVLSQAADTQAGSDYASGTLERSSAAAATQPASEQQASAVPVVVTDESATVQQAPSDKVQQASMHAVPSTAPTPTEPLASGRGDSEPATKSSLHMNGRAPPSLPAAQPNGIAVSSAAAQGAGLSKEPRVATVTAASRDHQLQAAALEGTTATSQAAADAGLSLPIPRSGSEFEVSWKRLKGNAAGQEGFLRQLDPLQLPALFKQSLTAPVLQGIALSALNMTMAQNDHFGIQLLEALKSVPRFDMIVMSLPRREKVTLKEHYDAAQHAPVVDSVLAKRLECVRRSYRL